MAAAVESMDGELIDTNSGALWDLFVASEDGRISTAAIEAKYRVLAQRNFILATDWAAETTADYPSLAIGWALMLIHEQDASTGDLPSDRRQFHEKKLTDLTVGPATKSDPDQLRWLALYARRLDADTVYAAIVNHLRTVDPTNQAVQLHDVAETLRTVPSGRWLATADSMWSAHGRGSQALVNLGFAAARASDDPAAFRRWMDRNAQAAAEPLAIVAEKVPKAADFAAVELIVRQAIVDSLREAGPEERSLYASESEHAARTAAALDEAQLELAWVELAAGDSATALALLQASEGALTDPGQLGRYADLLLARGDTALAALAAARIAADPLGSGEVPEQYDALPQMVGSERTVLLERGRVELERALLAHAPVPRPMDGNPTVVLRDGRRLPLRRLLGPRPTVLVFWSTQSPSSVQFGATASRLGNQTGVSTVHGIIRTDVVTEMESTAPELHDDPVVEDATEAAVAVRNSVLPQAVLLDGSLRVVTSSPDLNRLYRIAKLLR